MDLKARSLNEGTPPSSPHLSSKSTEARLGMYGLKHPEARLGMYGLKHPDHVADGMVGRILNQVHTLSM